MTILLNRPNEAFARLISVLQPVGSLIKIPPRKRLSWKSAGNPYIYILLEGEISISRVTDGILIASVAETHIFGFSEMFYALRSNLLRAETSCVLSRVEAEDARRIIDDQGLWKDVAEILAFHTNSMICRDLQIVNQRTIPIVCHYLRELSLQSDAIKERVNILKYIQERTGLSRSSILNVISSLKKDKFIDFERGGYKLRVHGLPYID